MTEKNKKKNNEKKSYQKNVTKNIACTMLNVQKPKHTKKNSMCKMKKKTM